MPNIPYRVLVVAVKAALYGNGWHMVLGARIGEAGVGQADRYWLTGGNVNVHALHR